MQSSHILKPGAGVIYGQAFVKIPPGKAAKAVGERVKLLPGTKAEAEYVDRLMSFQKVVLPSEMKDYVKVVDADADGNFRFENLAPGDYILLSRIITGDEQTTYFTHYVAAYTTLKKGKKKRVMVHRKHDWRSTPL